MKKIKLTQGQVALVDDSDFEWLNQWKWYAQKTKIGYYAAHRDGFKGRCIYMHRLILGIVDSKMQADHKDRITLNNQRCNLRHATASQNLANRTSHKDSISKYIGVCPVTGSKTWRAGIGKGGKRKELGSFPNEVEAAIAYNKAALELHGEFANLNAI